MSSNYQRLKKLMTGNILPTWISSTCTSLRCSSDTPSQLWDLLSSKPAEAKMQRCKDLSLPLDHKITNRKSLNCLPTVKKMTESQRIGERGWIQHPHFYPHLVKCAPHKYSGLLKRRFFLKHNQKIYAF